MEFKDKRGAHKLEALFHETIQTAVRRKGYEPIYSLRDYDHKGYPSAYNIYMSSIDERDAAMKLVGSMAHWRKLCSAVWFMEGRPECQFEGLLVWRDDMRARDATAAKKILLEQMNEENNITAAKTILVESRKKVKQMKKPKAKSSAEDSNVTDFLKKLEGK